MKHTWVLSIFPVFLGNLLGYYHLPGFQFMLSFYLSLGILGVFWLLPKGPTLILSFALALLAFKMPFIIYSLPIIAFALDLEGHRYERALPIALILINAPSPEGLIGLLVATAAALYLKYLYGHMQRVYQNYIHTFDHLTKELQSLENERSQMVSSREMEMENAILTERNRIARDIHDNIGHLLTRSILQIGALQSILKDEGLKANLSDVGATLTLAMDEVRKSVHNIHSDSIHFDAEIDHLIANFTFCRLDYRNALKGELPPQLALAVAYIVKEALTNVAKHSNATLVRLIFYENRDAWFFRIIDNGTFSQKADHEGIGIESMRKRMEEIGGTMTVSQDDGYGIFLRRRKDL